MKRLWFALPPIILFLLLVSCSTTRVLLKTAPTTPHGMVASPVLPLSSLEQWESTDRLRIQKKLETYVYGSFPRNLTLARKSQTRIKGTHFDNSATLTLETLEIANPATGEKREFGMVIVRPVNAAKDTPVIMMENYCPNNYVIPDSAIPGLEGYFGECDDTGNLSGVFRFFFGRYIVTPPIADIMHRGYALASVFPSEFVPDNAEYGNKILNNFFADQPAALRTHAVMAWAKEFSLLSKYLKAEKGFSRTVAFGHSRFAKSALVAAAFDSGIDAVVAHQSGTGGASLSKDKNGESIESVCEHYPHWFVPEYCKYGQNKADLPVDQHFLLALIAPRPMLLGNARRDVWSDPNGAFRAAQAASYAYRLYDKKGLNQPNLKAFNPKADITYWLRPGTHGVVKEDWPAFLAFLDAHFEHRQTKQP